MCVLSTMEYNEDLENFKLAKRIFIIIIFFILLIFVWTTYFYPLLKPWWAQQTGKAELAQAEQNRQIAVLEATAKKESAIQLAQAEIERAKGVAKANEIIGDSLKGNEEYLRYLWIDAIHDKEHQIIYVPTEANIPILEAGRR